MAWGLEEIETKMFYTKIVQSTPKREDGHAVTALSNQLGGSLQNAM